MIELIPIGGGIIDGKIIYEPLADGSFLVCEGGRRSIVEVTPAGEGTPASLHSESGEYFFQGNPEPPFWCTPTRKEAQDWIDGKKRAPSSYVVYKMLRRYFEVFTDLEDDYGVDVLTLFAVQTHIKPILNSLFQLPISGPFGAGKTNLLMTLGEVCYHPFMEASSSPAARVRILKQVASSYFTDELDKTTTTSKGEDDNLALVINRTGYRRGFTYLRWDVERDTWVAIPIFFPLAYTFSSEVEQALRQRSIAEIAVSKSMDNRVPVINTARGKYARAVAKDLFFWRVEFLESAVRQGRLADEGEENQGDLVDDLLKFKTDEFRAHVYEELVRNFSDRDKKILELVFGREAELCYVALTVEKALGVDVVSQLAQALNRQFEAISSEPDSRFIEFRLMVVAGVHAHAVKAMKGKVDPGDKKGQELAEAFVKAYFEEENAPRIDVPVSPLLESVRFFAKEHKFSEKLGPRTLGTWYKRLGIVAGRNKFHSVDGDYLSIDLKTWTKIINSMKAEKIDTTKLPPPDSTDATDAKTQPPGGVSDSELVPQILSGKSSIASIASFESPDGHKSQPSDDLMPSGGSSIDSIRSFESLDDVPHNTKEVGTE